MEIGLLLAEVTGTSGSQRMPELSHGENHSRYRHLPGKLTSHQQSQSNEKKTEPRASAGSCEGSGDKHFVSFGRVTPPPFLWPPLSSHPDSEQLSGSSWGGVGEV